MADFGHRRLKIFGTFGHHCLLHQSSSRSQRGRHPSFSYWNLIQFILVRSWVSSCSAAFPGVPRPFVFSLWMFWAYNRLHHLPGHSPDPSPHSWDRNSVYLPGLLSADLEFWRCRSSFHWTHFGDCCPQSETLSGTAVALIPVIWWSGCWVGSCCSGTHHYSIGMHLNFQQVHAHQAYSEPLEVDLSPWGAIVAPVGGGVAAGERPWGAAGRGWDSGEWWIRGLGRLEVVFKCWGWRDLSYVRNSCFCSHL